MTVRELAEILQGREVGYFIAFEGGDGAGKTTHLQRLGAELAAEGVPVVTTREPGGTPLGREIRELVMHGETSIDPRAEALLYAADRAQHIAAVVQPALAEGTTVITDRYIDSSVAYQAAGRGLAPEDIRGLSTWATDGLLPDVTMVLDLDTDVAVRRRGADRDRIEKAGQEFHDQVINHYRQAAAADPDRYYLIDADQNIDDVYGDIVAALVESLPRVSE